MLAGGGTGGHIYPLVAVADEIRRQPRQNLEGAEVEIQFIGDSAKSKEGDIFNDEAKRLGIKFRRIMSPKWRRYFSFENLLDIFKFPIGLAQSLFYVWLFMPDVMFAKGGYASFLPALAARIFMIPLAIHESDAVPGKTTLFLSRLSQKVFLSLEAAKKYFKPNITEVVGNPIRSLVLNQLNQAESRKAFSLDPTKPTLLIIGASQGSKIINNTIILGVVELVKKFQVIHQTGPNNFKEISQQLEKVILEGKDNYGQELQKNYRIFPILNANQMSLAYSAADVVVSRAGSSIFEIAAAGKPAILIPLKISASNHQLANARELAKFGAEVIEEDNLTPHILLNEIEKTYEKRAELSEKIKGFSHPDAAEIIAKYLIKIV